jgi:hypothetical protein
MKTLTPNEILALPVQENDAGAKTIRDYLVCLLTELWSKGESFSGKRSFRNSGWEHDLYAPLVMAEVVSGSLDDEGCLEECDEESASDLIFDAIDGLRG